MSRPFALLPGLISLRNVALSSFAYSSAAPSLENSVPFASSAFCDEPWNS